MKCTDTKPSTGEEGYFLVGLVVVCFLLLLALGVAAPRVAKQLEREREVESEHRAQEYVHAISVYYIKNHSYPTSLDQLTGSGSTGFSSVAKEKYLRQAYKDPLTGGEYRLIHFGEAKTEVKGFFGEPLQGLATSNLGTPAGPVSGTQTGSGFSLNGPGSSIGGAGSVGTASSSAASGASQGFSFGSGTSGSTGVGSAPPSTGISAAPGAPASPGVTGTTDAANGLSGSGGTGMATGGTAGASGSGAPTSGYGSFNSGSTSATSFQGNKGAIVGVGSKAKGHGLVEWNGSENIEDWEFLYDPRVEQMRAKSLLGGSGGAGGSLGSGFKSADGSTALGFGQGTPASGGSGGSSGSSGANGFGSGFTLGSQGSSSLSGGSTGTAGSPGTVPPSGPVTQPPQQ